VAGKLGVLEMNEKPNQEHLLEVSVVLPAYNEANKLETAVTETAKALEEFARSYEIIIAEDGSTDGTDKVAAALSGRYSFVKHLHGEKRLGRGAALKNAFKQSNGEILVYMDVDLATSIEQLRSLVKAVEEEEFDFATGSRLLSESKVERSRMRNITSKSYNFLVRAMLGSKVKDHQCGFKAFKREALLQLLDEVAACHWFWDTELLVRAARKGYAIKEIPVDWKSPRETKVRLLKDSFSMGWQVVKLWWRLKRQ
jgi:glycosyltransferase involved in cell wall biosynthesis